MRTTAHTHPPATAGTTDEHRRAAAQVYERQRRAFRAHAAVFAAGMAVIVLVNLLTSTAAGIAGEWSSWWSAWALIGWGIGVAVHGLVVRMAPPGVDEAPASPDAAPGR